MEMDGDKEITRKPRIIKNHLQKTYDLCVQTVLSYSDLIQGEEGRLKHSRRNV